MKAILKTIDPNLGLDYGETFTSAKNRSIRRNLVKELQSSLAPNYYPSAEQLNRWLCSLHKSRRSQQRLKNSDKIGEDKRRTHMNNRVHDVINVLNFDNLFPSLCTDFVYI